ncbi:aminoglycoside phosphotransferase family protein [Streptomyces sp. NPDC046860]|uniref:aminoglycoside phosphotransferase family protein n=1 Tax=Streptomyces sp. NPDC046860 TaxID=3154495 RepID=UPI0033F403E8
MTRPPIPTPDTVRALVRSLLRSGAAQGPEVRPVEAGRPYTWWVGTGQVLRLAPDREASVRLRREARVRDLVRPHLPVALPSAVAYGEWSPGLACTLDARLPGEPGHEVSALGEADLAGLFTGLRAVPARQAETLGVPRVPPRSLEALRRIAAHAAEQPALADEPDVDRLRQLTPAGAAQLAAQTAAAVLTHRRLTGDHVLISGDGRVRGVLDWTGAGLGDPAEDIAALAASVGAPAAVRAATLAGYGPRPCLRGLWLARCDTVIALAGHPGTPDAAPLRPALLRAWEPIMLERVTELKDDE